MVKSRRRTLSKFSDKAREIFESYNLVALRDKRNGFLINVCSSEEGLEFSTDIRKKDRYVFYKDANPVMKQWKITTTDTGERKTHYKLVFEGDLSRHPQYVIENPYVPMDHLKRDGTINSFFQVNEFRVSQKGMKYTMNYDFFQRNLDKAKVIELKRREEDVLKMVA